MQDELDTANQDDVGRYAGADADKDVEVKWWDCAALAGCTLAGVDRMAGFATFQHPDRSDVIVDLFSDNIVTSRGG